MTKKAQLIPVRQVIWLGWKLVIALSVALCFFALFRLHFQSDISSASYAALSRARSRLPRFNFTGRPKVAFLFLARRNLPLDFLWGSFFENAADGANFSIYIHSAPGYVFDEITSRSHFFYNRQLKNSIQVDGKFWLLSFLDAKEGRYNPKMSPIIPKVKWRKGSQWISLIRSHAEIMVDDEVVFSVFKKFCKRRPPLDASKGKLNDKLQQQHNCIPDEHYVATLFAMNELEVELERRTLTYTEWNLSATKMENKAWHPITFTYATGGPQKINQIKAINHVYYETEYRTEWCHSNSTNVPCFLFARKFSGGAAMRLLSEGVVGQSHPSSLLDPPA